MLFPMELTPLPPRTTSKGSWGGVTASYIEEIQAEGLLPRPNPMLNPMITPAAKSHQQAAAHRPRAFARATQMKSAALAFGEQVRRPCNLDPFGEVSFIGLEMSRQLDALLA